MKFIRDLIKLIRTGKMGLDSWKNLKYLTWSLGNFYFWYSNYSLTDFLIINGMIFVIDQSSKVYSAAIGIMSGIEQVRKHEKEMLKQEITNIQVDELDVN